MDQPDYEKRLKIRIVKSSAGFPVDSISNVTIATLITLFVVLPYVTKKHEPPPPKRNKR